MNLVLSVISIVLGSFLLFVIQPLAAKALLPYFGGVPSVWNVCMMFFQGMLLLGYTYVYFLSRVPRQTLQYWIHFAVALASLIMLPIAWHGVDMAGNMAPALHVLLILLAMLGLPLFVVTATAPLAQAWFSRTKHPHAKDPYFLYASSNIGSLIALFGFPVLLEPWLGLQQLFLGWSILYGVFLCALSITVFVNLGSLKGKIKKTNISTKTITWQQRGYWVVLSFAPSSLLLAVTQYITTDVASVPLLWIFPLAIYLVAFIIAFSRKPLISHEWIVREQGIFLVFPLLAILAMSNAIPAAQIVACHLVGFFALTLVCVGELVARRPDKSHLEEFYVWMALGGVLGGFFNSIIAPVIFNSIYEYYIAIVLCLLLRPWQQKATEKASLLHGAIVPSAVILLLAFSLAIKPLALNLVGDKDLLTLLSMAVIVAIVIIYARRPIILASSVAILFAFVLTHTSMNAGRLIWQGRSFFGVTRVYSHDDLKLHTLVNGNTLHGMEILGDPGNDNKNITYYSSAKLVGQLYQQNIKRHIGVVGLGAGTTSCLFNKGDEVSFFEIDPNVVNLAENENYFTYLKRCPPKGGILIGDGRLLIQEKTDHYFDILVIDAFSSDAIPVHLITQEAVKTYLTKLKQDGVIAFHISNRHLNLMYVLSAIKDNLGAYGAEYYEASHHGNILPSNWVVLSRDKSFIERLALLPHWQELKKVNKSFVWTDDFSNILRVMIIKG